jgi:protein O-mannosyl-transferase
MSRLQRAARFALFALPVIVYASAMDTPFHYDDFHSIVDNPHIRQLQNIPSFFVDPTTFSHNAESAMWRPLLLSSFALNYAISAYQVWSYHLVTLLFHLGCAGLVYGLGRRLLGAELPALLAAALFAIHPINSESVNYISSRSEVMAVFFVLSGLWFYARMPARSYMWVWVGAAFGAGLMSKSIVIILPALLLMWGAIFRRDLRAEKALWGGLLAIAICYVLVVWKFLAKATVQSPVRPYGEQLWTQIKALVFYLKMMVWPSAQSIDHQFLLSSSPLDPIAGPALLFIASLLWAAFYWRRLSLLPLFCLVFFAIALAPASLVPLNVLVNEHRLYLPSVAFCWFVAYLWQRAQLRGVLWRRAALAVVPLVLGTLSLLTYGRNIVWQDALSLWGDAASKAPLMARPHIYWGEALLAAEQWTEAERAFRIVVLRDPSFSAAYIRLSELYMRRGAVEEAVAILARGTQLPTANAALWGELAAAERAVGDWQKSMRAYRRAVELAPDDVALLNNMGNTHQVLNEPRAALSLHLRALDVEADNPQTWVNLGNAHAMLGEGDKALQAFERATRLDPSFAGAWMSLGGAYEKIGAHRKALEAYERGAHLDATYKPLLNKKRSQLQAGRID